MEADLYQRLKSELGIEKGVVGLKRLTVEPRDIEDYEGKNTFCFMMQEALDEKIRGRERVRHITGKPSRRSGGFGDECQTGRGNLVTGYRPDNLRDGIVRDHFQERIALVVDLNAYVLPLLQGVLRPHADPFAANVRGTYAQVAEVELGLIPGWRKDGQPEGDVAKISPIPPFAGIIPEGAIHDLRDHADVERLLQELHRPFRQGPFLPENVPVTADDHDPGFRGCIPDAFQDIDPVHVGELEPEENEVEGCYTDRRETVPSRPGDARVHPSGNQLLFDRPTDTNLTLENRSLGAQGEATLGQALGLAIQEWDAGNRERELRLHLLFLAWYCNLEPPHLTGCDETVVPSTRLPGVFSAVYETFAESILDDAEALYVVGLIANLTPWLLGGDHKIWEARSRDFRVRYRALVPDGLDPSTFEGRGAYGDYFAGQVQVPGGF